MDETTPFKVPAAVGVNESVSSTKCEVSQTSVGLGESVLESSLVVGREETDSATTVPTVGVNDPVAAVEPREIRLTETNAAVIGQQPPVESLNVKPVVNGSAIVHQPESQPSEQAPVPVNPPAPTVASIQQPNLYYPPPQTYIQPTGYPDGQQWQPYTYPPPVYQPPRYGSPYQQPEYPAQTASPYYHQYQPVNNQFSSGYYQYPNEPPPPPNNSSQPTYATLTSYNPAPVYYPPESQQQYVYQPPAPPPPHHQYYYNKTPSQPFYNIQK